MPELLGKEEPDLREFAGAEALRFDYRYNILPEGLLPRFIVRSRALNKNLPRWRTGVGGLYLVGASTWPGAGTGAGSGYMLAKDLVGA